MIPNKDTFCIAPYQHAEVDPQGFLKVCCVSREKKLDYKYKDIETWFKSEKLKKLRANLNAGIKDPICQNCWAREKHGEESQRKIYNKHIGKIIEKLWDKNFSKNITLKESIENIDTSNIRSFDLKPGNLCNLKCIMCFPGVSSQLMAEAKLHPAIKNFYKKEDMVGDFSYPESDQFKRWCDEFLKHSIHIKFTGGEPFMNPYLLDTVDSMPSDQKKKCILHFTTNLTKVNEKILGLFDKFKEVWLSVSVEGIGDLLEYARYGHQWDNLEKNMLTVLGRPNVHVDVSHVVQAPTFIGIKDLVRYMDQKKIEMNPIFLSTPECYHISAVKTKYKEDFLTDMQNYNGYNKVFVDTVKSYVTGNLTYDKSLAEQCVSRLQSFDKVRKNSFTKVVPVDYFI